MTSSATTHMSFSRRGWLGRSQDWGVVQPTGLACGALVARTLAGFLAPVPAGADPIGKCVPNAVCLVLALGVCVVARDTARRASGQRPNPVGMAAGGEAWPVRSAVRPP